MNPITIILLSTILISVLIIIYVLTYNKLHYYKVRIEVAENIVY